MQERKIYKCIVGYNWVVVVFLVVGGEVNLRSITDSNISQIVYSCLDIFALDFLRMKLSQVSYISAFI